jgi:hypothetical protein
MAFLASAFGPLGGSSAGRFSKERQRRASIDATTLNAACYDKKVLAPRRS